LPGQAEALNPPSDRNFGCASASGSKWRIICVIQVVNLFGWLPRE
jgi:hypothetical protein